MVNKTDKMKTERRKKTPEERKAFGEKMKAAREKNKNEREKNKAFVYEPPQNDNADFGTTTENSNTEQINTEKMEELKTAEQIAELRKIIEQQQAILQSQNEKIEKLSQSTTVTATGQPIEVKISPEILRGRDERNKTKFGGALRKEIPPEDRLDMVKTYIYVGGGYVMNVYLKNGSEVYAPYDKSIEFKPYNTEIRKTQNGDVWYTYSTFSTWSKKECEFIEGSPEWGSGIFSKIKDAQKVDPTIITKIKEAADIANKLTEHQLIEQAQSYHITVAGKSLDEIRAELKQFKLAEILQKEQHADEEKIRNLQHHDMSQRQI